jgi:prephenate dehydrogenase
VIVAIHGLGLMGASLGAALRRGGAAARVIGIARRPETARRAVELGAADEAATDLAAAAGADLLVLATPVRVILQTLERAGRVLKPGATLTDLGSTKAEILKAAAGLPFVGGHPMAGNEKAGVEGCSADLYVGRPYLIVPGASTRPADLERVTALARGVGALPIRLPSAEEHDRIVAANSHVPYLIAHALMQATPQEVRRLAGPSFQDATRVSASPPEMVLDFLLTNGPAIREAAGAFQSALAHLVELLDRRDEAQLRAILRKALDQR